MQPYSMRQKIGLLVSLGLVLLGFLTWANYYYSVQNPGGNDFLVHWMGTRSLLFDGLNPYSDEVALRIQDIAYGRPIQPGEHELRVAYPLYSVIVFFPFALIGDYAMARALWMTVIEIQLVLLTILSLRLVRWRIGVLSFMFLLLFALFWYHSLRSLINGNAVVLVAVALVGALLALRDGYDELAGILLALSTIKPQVVLLVLVYVTIWAIFQKRWRLIIWMAGFGLVLVILSTLVIPSWITDNLREVIRYPTYNPPGSPQAAFLEWWDQGLLAGLSLTIVVVSVLISAWFTYRSTSFSGFLWTVCLTLTISPWTGIQTDPGNFIVMFPVIIMVLYQINVRYPSGGKWLIGFSLLFLFIGIWAIFLSTVESTTNHPIQSSAMFFPLPAYLLPMLYLIRKWNLPSMTYHVHPFALD